MAQGRIPHLLSLFDKYIRNSVTFLLSINPATGNAWWQDLGLTGAEINQLQQFLGRWYTGNPANPGAYELHINPNTKTKKTREDISKIISDFTAFMRPLLLRMSGSANLTDGARLALRIAAPNASRTKHREAIKDTVNFIVTPLGGGDMRFTCRTKTDTKRASKAKFSDSVQLAYKIGDPSPISADDESLEKESFTRAAFTLNAGSVNAGKKCYTFARWYNTKHPELAGPWSALNTSVIA